MLQGIEYSYHAAGAIACTCLVHLHGINTLYHAMLVCTRMHNTFETFGTLALCAWVSKLASAVLYICVYTSTTWYNLYSYYNYIAVLLVCYVEPNLSNYRFGTNSEGSRRRNWTAAQWSWKAKVWSSYKYTEFIKYSSLTAPLFVVKCIKATDLSEFGVCHASMYPV